MSSAVATSTYRRGHTHRLDSWVHHGRHFLGLLHCCVCNCRYTANTAGIHNKRKEAQQVKKEATDRRRGTDGSRLGGGRLRRQYGVHRDVSDRQGSWQDARVVSCDGKKNPPPLLVFRVEVFVKIESTRFTKRGRRSGDFFFVVAERQSI